MSCVNLHAINLNLLVSLRALLQERSVTRAARSAGVSQPAMSRSLSQLRQIFDDPLLVRVGHDMALTPRAADLVAPLTDVLDRADALLAPQAFDPESFEARVTLLLNDYTGTVWLPSFVAALRRAAPKVDLDILHPGPEPFRRLTEQDAWLVCDSMFDHPPGYHMAPCSKTGSSA